METEMAVTKMTTRNTQLLGGGFGLTVVATTDQMYQHFMSIVNLYTHATLNIAHKFNTIKHFTVGYFVVHFNPK